MHRRLVVLMIEVEQPEGLSARKLVLETAKHNVLTAYTGKEGLALLRKFPNVDAVVVHARVRDMPCPAVVQQIKRINSNLPVIVLSPEGSVRCAESDFSVPSHEPVAILNLLAQKFSADTSN